MKLHVVVGSQAESGVRGVPASNLREIDAVRGLRVTPNANSRYRALLESK